MSGLRALSCIPERCELCCYKDLPYVGFIRIECQDVNGSRLYLE